MICGKRLDLYGAFWVSWWSCLKQWWAFNCANRNTANFRLTTGINFFIDITLYTQHTPCCSTTWDRIVVIDYCDFTTPYVYNLFDTCVSASVEINVNSNCHFRRFCWQFLWSRRVSFNERWIFASAKQCSRWDSFDFLLVLGLLRRTEHKQG